MSTPISRMPAWSAASTQRLVLEITGASTEIDAFIELMEPLGLTEVSRAGVVAIARGAEDM